MKPDPALYKTLLSLTDEVAQIPTQLSPSELNDRLKWLFATHQIDCLGYVKSHSHAVQNGKSTVTVTARFEFMNPVGVTGSCRSVGVHVYEGETLTNYALFAAKTQALLNLFDWFDLVDATPVSEIVQSLNKAITGDGYPALTTADQIAPPKKPTKRELAEQTQALLVWQNTVDTLSDEAPGDWDAHALKLKDLAGIENDEQKVLFTAMKEKGKRMGVLYNSTTRRFYLSTVKPATAPSA